MVAKHSMLTVAYVYIFFFTDEKTANIRGSVNDNLRLGNSNKYFMSLLIFNLKINYFTF